MINFVVEQKYNQVVRILLAFVILFTFTAQAQVMQWSSPKKLKGAAIFTKVVGENEDGVFLLRYRNRFYSKNVIVEKYNHLLVYQKGRSIDLKNARLVKIYLTKNGILLIKSQYNRKTQNNDLLAQWLDFELNPSGDEVTLASTLSTEYGNRGNYRLRISDDKNLIALQYYTEGEDEKYILHHKLIKQDLSIVSEKHLALPYTPATFGVVDFGVTNSGKTTFLTKHRKMNRRKLSEVVQSIYTIDRDTTNDYILSDSLELKNAELVYKRKTDNFVAVGLYGSPLNESLDGILFYEIVEGEPQLVNHRFNEEFIAKVNVNSKREVIPAGYEFLEVIPRSDGGILCVIEQKDIASENKIVMVNGIPQSTSKNVYNFNEILVLNFDNEGFMDWSEVIIKNQTTINDGGYFSSAVVFISDKFVQLIFNDQLRNSGEIMQYKIYNNGKVVSTKLLKTELDYVAVIPGESKQVASNKVIIPTSKNRRFALLKLIYP